jgi:hypothetical protein
VIRVHRVLAFGALFLLVAAVSSAGGALKPGRSVTRPGPIVALSVTGSSVVYAVGETRPACAYVELWDTATHGLWRFGRPTRLPCKEGLSTGSGVWSVATTTGRAVWITYAGGNIRDWQLWTATPSRKTPRQLRFVSRDVDAPAPIVVGPGTAEGVPYAVDRDMVFLAPSGAAFFKARVDSPVRLVAGGHGPGGSRVAAALADGSVVLVAPGKAVVPARTYPPGTVKAVALATVGPIVQVGRTVHAGAIDVQLPAGALMLDYRDGRVVYAKGGEVRQRRVRDGADALLVRVPLRRGETPLFSVDRGSGWASGRTVNWRTGSLPLLP